MAFESPEKNTCFLPISEISAYHSRWTIKGRVTVKTPVRNFGKADGKVFSAEFVDETGGDIRASFFNDAVTKYVDTIQVGKVYTLSNGTVRVANKQYNNTNHRYELNFDRGANVEEVVGEEAIYKEVFNFVDLRAIQSRQLPCRADLCGVVTQFGSVTTLTAKDGRELIKREITIADDTATTMVVTLWAEKAQLPDSNFEGKPIVAISKSLVKEFGGERTASLSQSSSVVFKPDVPEAKRIEQWWSQGGSKQSLGHFTSLEEIQTKVLPCRADICGIVTQSKEVTTVTSKDGRELFKRDLVIADDSGVSMDVTLWGDKGKLPDADFEGNPVICVTAVFVKEFNGGRSASTLEASRVTLRTEGDVAARVQQWWSQGGSTQSLVSMRGAGGGGGGAAAKAEHCTVAELRQKSENVSDQAQLFKITCRLGLVQLQKQGEQQPLHYSACAELRDGSYGKLPCNKRVDSSGFCASCDRAGKTVMRLNARCRFSDCGDSLWLTTFHEAAEKVLGMSAEKVAEIDGSFGGREKLEEALREKYFAQPMELLVRAKLDSYNGEPRTNVTCVGAAPINRRERGMKMLAEIQEMIAETA